MPRFPDGLTAVMGGGRIGRWARRALLAAALGLVAFGSAELTARIDDYVRWGTSLAAVPDFRRDLFLRDSLGPRGRPNGVYRDRRLNAYGFRSPPMDSTPRPGCVRVMVLGASEAFGHAETAGKEFPAQLGDTLRHRGGSCWEVLNAAVPASHLPDLLRYWKRWGAGFAPHLVLIYPTPIFYLEGEGPARFEDRNPRLAPRPWWTSRLLMRFGERLDGVSWLQRARAEWRIRRLTAGKDEAWFFFGVPPERLALLATHLDSLTSGIRAAGAEPVLMTHAIRAADAIQRDDLPSVALLRRWAPRARPEVILAFEDASAERIRALAEERRVLLVDLAGAMNGRRDLFTDWHHFTDEGAGVAAGVIAERLLGESLGRPWGD